MICPACESDNCVKNGHTHYGKPRFKCKACGRQFVEGSQYRHIPQETWEIVDKLLLEKSSQAGIARVTGISERHLQSYINKKLAAVPREVKVLPKKLGKLIVEMDEMWSFFSKDFSKKSNKAWIWLALDAETREVVGAYVGNRSAQSARRLWESLPGVYRQCAVCYTDYWEAYEAVLPSKRHRAVGKESGRTNHIERFNNTVRQRVSRLVRKTLSFPKKLENHIGALWLFLHHYNAEIQARYHHCS